MYTYILYYTVLYCIYTDIILIRSDWYCYWYCYIPKHAWLATWQEHAKGGPSGAGDNGDAVPWEFAQILSYYVGHIDIIIIYNFIYIYIYLYIYLASVHAYIYTYSMHNVCNAMQCNAMQCKTCV